MEIKEPKFREGQKVRYVEDRNIYTIESVNSYSFKKDEYSYNLLERVCTLQESNLELYIEKPKTVWDLKTGDTYYVIIGYGNVIETTWIIDNNSRKFGNAFLTREEAEFEVERRKVETEMLRLGGRRNIKTCNDNYYIMYDHKTRNLAYFNRNWMDSQGSIFFDTYVDVDKAVKAIGEDRIKKYIFGVEE